MKRGFLAPKSRDVRIQEKEMRKASRMKENKIKEQANMNQKSSQATLQLQKFQFKRIIHQRYCYLHRAMCYHCIHAQHGSFGHGSIQSEHQMPQPRRTRNQDSRPADRFTMVTGKQHKAHMIHDATSHGSSIICPSGISLKQQ